MNEYPRSVREVRAQIKKDIEFNIINGKYNHSYKLPSILEICEMYKCGKSTAQRVLNEMCNEGTATKQQGIGYFVKPYISKKLLQKYIDEVEIKIEQIVQESCSLGIKYNTLKVMLLNKLEEIYKK